MPVKTDATEKPATRLRRRAMDFLARREHTFEELLQKMASRFPDDDEALIREVLLALQQENLLSDERFMESYLHTRQRAGMGPLKIAMELRQKGVADTEVGLLMASVSREEWQDLATEILRRKFSKAPDSPQARQKTWRFLMQRGFESEDISKAQKRAWI